ncbi:hypothetical protein B0A49_00554 [Cryomyces minteri]|uniref:beta-galactosidase n=1 Tax=Cryomyces minteri TaxID=331657 RepID=A0A4U0XUL4_9PEZI|nr:hypothetical protein B0A49_00554 [Cryomyces minteri]
MAVLLAWLRLALWLLTFSWSSVPGVLAQNTPVTTWPLHDDGLNKYVQWDHFSFKVDGKRLFVFSGEMHYWRLPVKEMWPDILQKIKASGANAFSFYGNWAYHAPNATTVDFQSGSRDFTQLFDIARSLGLYVIVRPGSYVNAEANAGGLPLWITTGAYGSLRNNDTRYTAAWEPYMTEFASLTSGHEAGIGGNAFQYQIENEYGQQWIGDPTLRVPNETAIDYMVLLEENARNNGIAIPLMHNNPNMYSRSWSKDWSNERGNVDVYGVDSYPACWSCNLDECTGTNGAYVAFKIQLYYDHFQSVAPTQPGFLPEFQGGSYNPWGGPQGGCGSNTGADFANLYYRHNIAEKSTAMSLYMMYGGTNWGAIGAPIVATSYDYSAPLSEDRSIGSKFYETKNLALFTRVAEDLRMTERLGNSTAYSTNSAILTTELRNPSNNAGFYVTVHADTTSSSVESFQLNVNTSRGALTIPQNGSIILNGHQSKIIVTDFNFGNRSLLYSTAEVLTYAVFDGAPALVLWVPDGESGEIYIKGGRPAQGQGQSGQGQNGQGQSGQGQQGNPYQGQGQYGRDHNAGRLTVANSWQHASSNPWSNGASNHWRRAASNVRSSADAQGLLVSFTQQKGMTVVQLDDGLRIVIVDRTSAYPFWVPTLTADPSAPVNETVLVQGPYLVRGASMSSDAQTIELTGDYTNATAVEVFAAESVNTISWNGQSLKTTKTQYGSLTAQVAAPDTKGFSLPALGPWKVHDSLPERLPSYSDSGPAWVAASHMTTTNPSPPATLPVLYVDEYGFHNGIHLWRGYFSGAATGVFLNVQGGTAFGWSAWLNGVFVGSFLGNFTQTAGNMSLSFSNATVNAGENVLLVMQDNNGHDQTSGALNPRGIMNATLLGGSNFTAWKVAGTAGGDNHYGLLDKIRGGLSEGGLTAERLGWHLPSFDDSAWNTSSPSTGFSGPGVHFYRTVVPLNVPAGLDVSLAFVLSAPSSQKFRAQLFVNGYQYGRFNPYIGHQVNFPVPPGILDYSGDNTIALAVWAQSEEGAQVGIDWNVQYVAASSFDVKFDGSYLRPGWTHERLMFA